MNMRKNIFFVTFFSLLIMSVFSSCYSVFTGGTGGTVVDAESTSTPKAGIANVDVYAYTSEKDRDADFSAWEEATLFKPAAEYYGHTTTGNDGSFSLSKIVWKSYAPVFGKDADVHEIFLLFYHENYGLVKGETLIVSDGTADTVYQELTKIRKTTVLNINMIDVSNDSATTENIYVKISVPQTTSTNTSAAPKIYDATISGSGSVSISYPRWQSEEDKSAEKETTPEVTITYYQSSDEITWKGCWNGDNTAKNYAFRDLSSEPVKKVVSNDSYNIRLYGKKTKLSMPVFSGQWGTDDGVVLNLIRTDNNENCGETTTYSQSIGTSGTEKHGVFSGLGSGCYWIDNSYIDKYAAIGVKISDGSTSKEMTVRSDVNSITVQK